MPPRRATKHRLVQNADGEWHRNRFEFRLRIFEREAADEPACRVAVRERVAPFFDHPVDGPGGDEDIYLLMMLYAAEHAEGFRDVAE